jgi:acylphosphatase
VRGRVQGVGFRAATAYEARRLGVAGWVRNLPDGTVEVEARGAPDAVDALSVWLGEGPRGARVTGVDIHELPTVGTTTVTTTGELESLDGFAIR